MTRKQTDKSHRFAVSDEAAAYIADALMQLALKFEAKHFAQIRRHYRSLAPERDDPLQLDLFGEPPSANGAGECDPNLGEKLRRESCADNALARGRRR